MKKASAAKVETKVSKSSETRVKAAKPVAAPVAKPKGRKFDGNWNAIPSTRQLLALVIRAIESGETMSLPTTRDQARAMLGYE